MEDRYIMLKIESVINKILYVENAIDEKKYKITAKKLDKLLYEERKKNSFSTLT